jgi:hypothetical protein
MNVYSFWGPANATGLVATTGTGASLNLYGYSQATGSYLRFQVYAAGGGILNTVSYTLGSSYPLAVLVIDNTGYLRLYACTDATCANQTQVWTNNVGSLPSNGCLGSGTCTSPSLLSSSSPAGSAASLYVGSTGTLYLLGGTSIPRIIIQAPPAGGGVIVPSPASHPPGPNVATVRCGLLCAVFIRARACLTRFHARSQRRRPATTSQPPSTVL